MKKYLLAAILILFCLSPAARAQMEMMAPRVGVFFPIYWVLGDAQSTDPNVSVEERLVMLYEPDEAGEVATLYGYGYIKNGSVAINPFRTRVVEVGRTYKVAIGRGADNYGSEPRDITISGVGYDRFDTLLLAYGVGPRAVDIEPCPHIKLWFGNRLYQPAIYNKDNPFVIEPTPKIEARISIPEPYTVSRDYQHYSISVDEATPFVLSSANMLRVQEVAEGFRAFSLEYAMTEDQALDPGEHVFSVSAQSSGAMGAASIAYQLATVEVMGGPLRLVGPIVVFPSPFSIRQHGTCTIQYTLSANANVEIYIYSVAGQIVKKLSFASGSEGGNTGLNKVTWDGRTEMGLLAGNAVYVGTLLSRDDNRLLGRFKFSIVD
jgi:hypothetical protein